MNAGLRMETNRSLFDDLQQQQTQEDQEQSGDDHDENQDDEERAEPVAAGPRVGRNDLCPCGSGKKYKKCCQVEGQPSA